MSVKGEKRTCRRQEIRRCERKWSRAAYSHPASSWAGDGIGHAEYEFRAQKIVRAGKRRALGNSRCSRAFHSLTSIRQSKANRRRLGVGHRVPFIARNTPVKYPCGRAE